MDEPELRRRSDALVDRDDWGPDALATNRELVELDPNIAAARFRLALCFEEAGDLLAARESFTRFLERVDEGLEARVARRHLAILEERARAIATPSAWEALARARKHQRSGELDRARVWYRRAEETAKTPTERTQALTGQATLLRMDRHLAQARETAERAVAAQPSRRANLAAYASLIAILADLGRLEQAREEADALLGEHPDDPIVRRTAGRVYSELFKQTGEAEYRVKAGRCFAQARRGR